MPCMRRLLASISRHGHGERVRATSEKALFQPALIRTVSAEHNRCLPACVVERVCMHRSCGDRSLSPGGYACDDRTPASGASPSTSRTWTLASTAYIGAPTASAAAPATSPGAHSDVSRAFPSAVHAISSPRDDSILARNAAAGHPASACLVRPRT